MKVDISSHGTSYNLFIFGFAERSRRLHGEGTCFGSKVLDGVTYEWWVYKDFSISGMFTMFG